MTIVKYVFTLVGIGMLVGSFFMYRSTNSFLAEAVKTEGTVVELVRAQQNNSTNYKPVVQFTSQSGQAIEFISSTGSNPPDYSEGQKVEVLYLPLDPQNAKINDRSSLWGAAALLGGMGSLFFVVGVYSFLTCWLVKKSGG